MIASRMRGMSPPVERSITVSAPSFRQTRSFASSASTSETTAELPMFALILQVAAIPMPIGSSSGWLTFAGMTSRPRATSPRTCSGSSRSRRATCAISSETTPSRARLSCVRFLRPRRGAIQSARIPGTCLSENAKTSRALAPGQRARHEMSAPRPPPADGRGGPRRAVGR